METCSWCQQELCEPARLLPCLHSACIGCIDSQLAASDQAVQYAEGRALGRLDQEKKVCCLGCGSEWALPRGGSRSLPFDPRTQDCMLQRCQLCSNAQTLAFCKCEECELLMCALCAETHIKFGDVGGHTILQLKDTRSRIPPRQQMTCSRHRTEEASYFCWDCRAAVCSQCCPGDHRLEDVGGAAKALVSLVGESLPPALSALSSASSASAAALSLLASINKRCDGVAKEVEEFSEAYRDAVDAHQAALLAHIEQIRERRRGMVEESRHQLEEWISTVNHVIQFSSYVTSSASPSQVVSVGGWTLERLEQMQASSRLLQEPNVSDWIQFLPEEKAPNATKFQLTGIISTQAVSPHHSAIDSSGGVLNCKQHARATFVLRTRDLDNKVLSHGGEKVAAEVLYKDASQRSLAVETADEGDGTYSISFVPDAAGSLLLSVLVRGIHCKGSPYTVAVSSSRQHKGVYHCCAFCSSGGSKAAVCACGAKMPGGYKGCGHGHVGHPGRRHWSCCGNVLQNSECGRPLAHQYSL